VLLYLKLLVSDALLLQCLGAERALATEGQALGHVPLKVKENALPCAQSTVGKQPLCAKNGHWVLHGLQF
jgi:hypothetical protein